MRRFALSLKLLWRDWRAGELRLFAAALVIAVGAVTAVGFFNDRVTRGMTSQSSDLLGADLVLVSPRPVPREWMDAAARHGLRSAETLDFASVVVRGDQLQLAAVRAVGDGYPLRGRVRTAMASFVPGEVTRDVPVPGTVWVEARLLSALGLKLGDSVQIGDARLRVTRVLTYEPGRGANFFSFAPHVLMAQADVARTHVIQPGSRVTYGYGFAGTEAALRAYHDWLQPRLTPNHRLLDPRDSNVAIGRAIDRVNRYAGLTSLLAVILAGVAIAMAARRYSERHYDTSAMLRCFGATQRDVIALHLPQLLVLGLLASVAGVALGGFAQEAIYFLMRGFFPRALPPPGARPALLGLLTGVITLVGFGFPPVLRLREVSPLRVLRRELAPLPASAWVVYGSALIAVVLLMWRYTENWTLTFGVLGAAVGASAALAALAWALLRAGPRLTPGAGVAWRFAGRIKAGGARQGWRACAFGVNNLRRHTRTAVGQVLAFGLVLMAMALIALVRTDLLATWKTQLPANTPNQFAFNILPADVAPMRRFFAKHDIQAQALYPMVRGRLVAIDGVPVAQAVNKEESNDGALRRELNLTWTETVPPDNAVVAGVWWGATSGHGVSVEEKLAKRLGIALGNELTFSIGGDELKARVTSLRRVQWDSFHPNFFMIFPPGVLDAYPATYITSFYLKPAQKPLLGTLVHEFPAVTVLETEQVLAQVRAVLEQVTFAVEFVLLFVLAAGLAVLYAALAASLDERLHEGALLRALGASRRQLRAGHLAEFALLGALAGVLAAVGTELTAFFLYVRVFNLEYSVKWPVWLIAPVAGAVLIGFAGYIGTRRVVRQSPLSVLREL
jgi:putative ABC transport system permease protein